MAYHFSKDLDEFAKAEVKQYVESIKNVLSKLGYSVYDEKEEYKAEGKPKYSYQLYTVKGARRFGKSDLILPHLILQTSMPDKTFLKQKSMRFFYQSLFFSPTLRFRSINYLPTRNLSLLFITSPH